MSFFKKLFGTKDDNTQETKPSVDAKTTPDNKSVVSETKITTDKPQTNDTKAGLSSVSRIAGLDDEFINLIHFPDDQTKQKHRDAINSALSKLKIKPGTDYHEVHEKLIDYNNVELDEPIPFFIESLLIENSNKGSEKIQGYYPAAGFISENIRLKLDSAQTDFSYEENLFSNNVHNSDLNNFAKLNSIFYLGLAFFKANNISKAEHYFDLLEKGPFDLQPSSLAGFYRSIGELYADTGDKAKALKWLNAGLTLNPKLGVKKLITKLEADK